jgi:Cellulose-binding Sde182, nucleoside hydrolase-like domain
MQGCRSAVAACFLGVTVVIAAAAAPSPRVIVSTDIGGTDPDDYQSLVHLLLYADAIDLEGLISSPFSQGDAREVLRVIDCYERDYPKLRSHSDRYPDPAALRAVTKQGALQRPGPDGFGAATEGSAWIVARARLNDPRPLHVLVWGSLGDLAQALHDAPDIADKLRVYFIGGPNKMWNADSYDYLEQHFPRLHFIESNSTYFGWFVGGDQGGEWGNSRFVAEHVKGHGALGDFFAGLRGGELKMGDTPSLAWVVHSEGEESKPGWGGQFMRVWDGRKKIFDRPTSEADEVEACGIVEFNLAGPAGLRPEDSVTAVFDDRVPVPVKHDGSGRLRFRFSPKSPKVWTYSFRSDFPSLAGHGGGKFTAVAAPSSRSGVPSTVHPNWWTDDPDPALAEDGHAGAKTVSRWRRDFLADFAARVQRCDPPASAKIGR